MKIYSLLLLQMLLLIGCKEKMKKNNLSGDSFQEKWRPQFHFTPEKNWMNDPNGMVFYKNEYHLFYQYYPEGNVWGPMHWGHAVSKDLMHWEHLPIALFPDSLGYIFSGSAVVDWNNTTGFKNGKESPIVAIFSYHKADNGIQTQGIAYSVDKGRTWTKYSGNPVIKNPGKRDFRDPKVFWFDKDKKWIMALATGDCISFYSSPDLKKWDLESEFGKGTGSHEGIWECPDLFPLNVKGSDEKKWVLLVSINKGAPFGGSATQYFVGDFDGKKFVLGKKQKTPLWLDYGKDNYAGVTWSDIPEKDGRRIFLGWMSNWQYAEKVPTTKWRSAMTLPCELSLINTEEGHLLLSKPVEEFNLIKKKVNILERMVLPPSKTRKESKIKIPEDGACVTFNLSEKYKGNSFVIKLSNKSNEQAIFIFDPDREKIRFVRNESGKIDFHDQFKDYCEAPFSFTSKGQKIPIQIVIDRASIELFVDEGLVQLTNIVFPLQPYENISIIPETGMEITDLTVSKVKSVWRNK